MADIQVQGIGGADDGGAGVVAGHGGDPSASVRETELSVRVGRGAARVGGPQLLQEQPNSFRDVAGGGGGGGAGGDGAVPGGQGGPGGPGGHEPRSPGRAPSSASALNEPFGASGGLFAGLVGFLRDGEADHCSHEQLEERLSVKGRELCRQLLQDHLDLRASREVRSSAVIDAAGSEHRAIEAGHHRRLETIFGMVTVTRLAYRAKGAPNLHPADAALNLPAELHSHGLRQLCAVEATRGSFEEATEAVGRAAGVGLAKRQAESLTARAAVDVDGFYTQGPRTQADPADVLVISADGKGIVMRPEGLRPGTAKAAEAATTKLATRLSKGEKRNRKRMAELAVVYDAAPAPRGPADVLAHSAEGDREIRPGPTATAKWLTASVVDDAATVVGAAFDEAERRDPEHDRTWVALLDGNNHQISRIRAEAAARNVGVAIVVDFVHVIEYLWTAAWCFFDEADPAAEAWVGAKGTEVLAGKAGIVAGAIGRKATCLGLDPPRRRKADEAARYLKNKKPYLDYPTALAAGWPIATGVIEGACRHLVRDRFDITGARWSVQGAEAILKLRAVRANGDWDDYWSYHLRQQRQRVHASRYADRNIPNAA